MPATRLAAPTSISQVQVRDLTRKPGIGSSPLIAAIVLSCVMTPAVAQRYQPDPYPMDPYAQPGPYGIRPAPNQSAQPGPYGIQPTPNQGGLEAEAAGWRRQVEDAIWTTLQRVALRQGNTLYVDFTLSSPNRVPPPGSPYASAVPFNSPAPQQNGLMAIDVEPPQASVHCVRADLRGCPPFRVLASMRVTGYRIYTPANGWRSGPMGMPHIWEWQGAVVGGALSLGSTTDAARGTSDGGLTEFVASVFNVPPANVVLSTPNVIPPQGPMQRSCGPRVLPNGQITGRACYN